MKNKKFVSLICLIIIVVLWGITPIIAKQAFDNYSPAMLVALRGLFSIIVLAIVINKKFKMVDKSYLICIPAGIFLACAYLFQFIGLNLTTPAKSTFLESFSCLAVPVFMFIVAKEKPTISKIICCVLCVIGSFILIGNGFNFDFSFNYGDLWSAIGGIFYGIDIAFTKINAKNKNPIIYVFFQLCILTIMAFVYSICFENVMISYEFINLVQVMFLGIICTALCWVLRTSAIKNVSAVTCAILMPFSAVISSVISILMNMEDFTYNLLVGGLIITLSIVIDGLFDAKGEKKNEQIEC